MLNTSNQGLKMKRSNLRKLTKRKETTDKKQKWTNYFKEADCLQLLDGVDLASSELAESIL